MSREERIWKMMYRLCDDIKTAMDSKLEEKDTLLNKITFDDIAEIKDFISDSLNNIFKTPTNE